MKIIGHRGSSGDCPENTMAAFRRAWACGADGIELDIRLTADGQLVVYHDETGSRLDGIDRRVVDCTWAELSDWNAGAGVPLLEDVLHAAPRSTTVLIELKSPASQVAAELKRQLDETHSLDISLLTFERGDSVMCVSALPGIPVMLNCKPQSNREIKALTEFARENGLAGLSMKWSNFLNRENIDGLNASGLVSAVWTVNTNEDVVAAKTAGVDMIMTDWPERMVALK